MRQGRGQSGSGQGSGRGQGRGGGGVDKCVCPNCGYEAPHQRGVPCVENDCPKCGTRMVGKW
ncbi:hypothetical protein AKJ62_01110 [candidate division MSBL1 archaeon SCGC-AAA259D14]|uniref:Ferredoxin n=2 Tax=candidate division MSBL1 TaxID=215777 RepID=A0A133U824_9EURY|nr:hypothetical protein AKJ61_01510 [candidate division MSBL1 archaeon SCGC-AAA259B11]KXA90352.1 hypothetical protein AKJ62_01110 [candidate division MSBL1 archaeon SCGC-AAA259D14]